MLSISEERLGNVPVLHMQKEELAGEPLPAVIFWHGFTSAKENNLHIAYHLANQNIRVILPEALHHGERDSGLSEKEKLLKFWHIVLQSVKETQLIREHLKEKNWLDNDRLFVSGTSMGGIITCGVMTAYSWVKGGAVFMGSPAWEAFARQQIRILEQQGSLSLSAEEADKEVKDLIPLDLSQNVSKVGNRPLFFWHGQRDDVVPYTFSHDFFTQLKKERESDATLTYHLDPAAGHKVNRQGILAMTEWTAEHI